LTPKLREKLKAPLGLLIQGSFRYTMKKLKELIEEAPPEKLIAVGDRVSRNMISKDMPLDVVIIDNKVMRKPIKPVELGTDRTYRVTNPAGTISPEAFKAIKEAVSLEGRSKILVEGEEDLLTLVAVLSAPNGSMVVYGQPKKGIVIVQVTEDSKRRIREILEQMEDASSKH